MRLICWCWILYLPLVWAQELPPGVYRIDPDHSAVTFTVQHARAGLTFGRFRDISGELEIAEKPDESRLQVQVPVGSVDMNHRFLNGLLMSERFFDASRFPTMVLAAKGARSNQGQFELTAQVTLRGQTRPMQFQVRRTGIGKGMVGETRVGYVATGSFKRSDYGMQFGLPDMIGDEIALTVYLEVVWQPMASLMRGL